MVSLERMEETLLQNSIQEMGWRRAEETLVHHTRDGVEEGGGEAEARRREGGGEAEARRQVEPH